MWCTQLMFQKCTRSIILKFRTNDRIKIENSPVIIQFFEKTAASMLRVGVLFVRRWQMRVSLKCNAIQGWITRKFRTFLPRVRLTWNSTEQISVGSELSPQGSSWFRCAFAALHLNFFCVYPIWARAGPAALGLVVLSEHKCNKGLSYGIKLSLKCLT
jgi:hypothetical protein